VVLDPSPESGTEWVVGRHSFTGNLLPLWAVLCGCGAWAVAAILFAATSGPGPGPFFAVVGSVILGSLAWVYYFAGIRRVAVTSDRTWRFTGPRRDYALQAGDVLSITRWWSDWTSWIPLYVRTTQGRFFLLPRLRGPSDLLETMQAANPRLQIRLDGGWRIHRSTPRGDS
jgi:hypothetical protein